MKRALLDTHTMLWALSEPRELGLKARKLIEADSTVLYLSLVSLWEIAVKVSLKKLSLKLGVQQLVEESVHALGVKLVPIDIAHIELVASLPFHHRDPFDRLLVTTASTLGCPILSKDNHFDAYKVRRIWN